MDKNAETLRKAFSQFSVEADDALSIAIKECAIAVETDAKKKLTSDGHVDRGILRASINHRMVSKARAEIGSNAKYAAGIEFGTSPHSADLSDLQAWARRKGLDNPDRAGFFIWQHIKRYGTKPYPFLVPSFKGRETFIKARIQKAMAKSVNEANK